MSLRHAILVCLWEEEGTGYEIAKRFQEGLGYSWTASHPQIYTELAKMTKENLVVFEKVEQEHKPAKKIYNITEKGVDELRVWLAEPTPFGPIRDGFLIKMTAGALADPAKLLLEVELRQEIVSEKLDYFYHIEKLFGSKKEMGEAGPEHMFPYLALRAYITTFESYGVWFKEVVQYLEDLIAKGEK